MPRRQVFSSMGLWIHLQIGVAGLGKKGKKGKILTKIMMSFERFMEKIT